jgi:hypothetical protein
MSSTRAGVITGACTPKSPVSQFIVLPTRLTKLEPQQGPNPFHAVELHEDGLFICSQ